MIKNYLLIALRNLSKNKSYVIINTLGLGIALACCITAYLLLAYNIEFDSFHNTDSISTVYKVHTHYQEKDGRNTITHTTPLMLAPTIASEVAGVEQFTRWIGDGGSMSYGSKAFSEGIVFADSSFFHMFDFPVVKGSTASFANKHSIIISEKLAEKYFGDEDPIGKNLVLTFQNDQQIDVMVGAVIDKVPLNSTFVFDAIMRFENYIDIHKLTVDMWGDWRDPSAFVKLKAAGNATTANDQLSKYVKRRNEAKRDAVVSKFDLQPFMAAFTQSDIGRSYVNHRMSMVPLVVFTSMAGLILLIACFNLTNTSIAMTSKRLKEVGVRKTIGAARHQIVLQFIFETILSICLALVVALGLSQVIVPAFTDMWRLPYGMEDLSGINLFIALIILIFLVALLAGVYPAMANSKFSPVSLLKGKAKIGGGSMLSRILVSMQFALSVIVLIAGVMFIRNTKFQEQIDYGYDKEMVINVNIQSHKQLETLENDIRSNPKISLIGATDHQVGFNNYESPVQVDTAEYAVRHLGVGKNYMQVMGFTLVEGRFFDAENAADLGETAIVNRAFVKKAGLDDPLDKIVVVHGSKRHIVGVIEDHVDNVYRSKEPEAFVFYPNGHDFLKSMIVRTDPANRGEVQKAIEDAWKRLFPSKPFISEFQEDVVLRETKELNGNLKVIFLFLTTLGGLLSAAGIFSLASLNISKRTKEIGIRKALGASVPHVMALLNREFVIILSAAAVLGSVGGYFLTKMLMDNIYANHIAIGIIPVILCAVGIFAMGIATTSSTIFKAAKSNPVDTLRAE